MIAVVWSVFVLLTVGLAGTAFIIYYILEMAYKEMQDVQVQDKKDKQSN